MSGKIFLGGKVVKGMFAAERMGPTESAGTRGGENTPAPGPPPGGPGPTLPEAGAGDLHGDGDQGRRVTRLAGPHERLVLLGRTHPLELRQGSAHPVPDQAVDLGLVAVALHGQEGVQHIGAGGGHGGESTPSPTSAARPARAAAGTPG